MPTRRFAYRSLLVVAGLSWSISPFSPLWRLPTEIVKLRAAHGMLGASLGAGQATCGGGSGGSSSSGSSGQAGVMIGPGAVLDAHSFQVNEKGVAHSGQVADPGGMLTRQRLKQAKAALNADIAKPSPIRKVSLTRLERAIQAQLENNRRPTDEMLRLAGLTRIRYVFFYPDSGDVVVAGPAEGWFQDLTGRFIGMASNRPTLELQDLVVALRAFSADKDPRGVIGCSIDPTPEGLARMQKFLQGLGRQVTPDQQDYIVEGLHSSLGLQKVRILGISPDTHFAQVMLEADYRMKLIGIGGEHPNIKLASFVELANPAQMSRNALQRWWFVPDYECVRLSADRLAMELVGEGVKLVGEDEVVGPNGQRMAQGKSGRASQMFSRGFTQKYAELARRKPIYAQLRNLIDMAIVAAHIQREDYYGKAGWNMEVLGSEELFPVQVYKAPVEVDTVVTSMWKGNTLVTPVGGGVRIEAPSALESSNLLPDKDARVEKARQAVELGNLKAEQWWWD